MAIRSVLAVLGVTAGVLSVVTGARATPVPPVAPINYIPPAGQTVDVLPGWYKGINVCQDCRSPVPVFNGVRYSDAFWVDDGQNQAYALREPANPGTNDTFGDTTIPSPVPGVVVELFDFDIVGHEGGSHTPVPSDYIYESAGTIWFASDSENFTPTLPGPVTASLAETGRWQDLSTYFGYLPGTFFVASDVPEPASAAVMLAGLIGLGLALRRGKSAR